MASFPASPCRPTTTTTRTTKDDNDKRESRRRTNRRSPNPANSKPNLIFQTLNLLCKSLYKRNKNHCFLDESRQRAETETIKGAEVIASFSGSPCRPTTTTTTTRTTKTTTTNDKADDERTDDPRTQQILNRS